MFTLLFDGVSLLTFILLLLCGYCIILQNQFFGPTGNQGWIVVCEIVLLWWGYSDGVCIHCYAPSHTWNLECPRSRRQIISRDTTLLSPSNITATRSFLAFPPSYFSNYTIPVWCAPPGPTPNVSLSFVLITGFIPGGYSALNGSNPLRAGVHNLYTDNLGQLVLQVRV